MTWFKVDDGFCDHPKVDALHEGKHAEAAIALWTIAGCWCAKQLTDGFVPIGRMRRFGLRNADAAAAELVRVGLWLEVDGGFQFHEWTDHQPPREKVLARRASAAERQRRRREKGAGSGDGHASCHAVTDAVTAREVTRSDRVSHSTPTRPDPTRPDLDRVSGSDQVARGLSLARPGGARSLVAFGDEIRSGLVEAMDAEGLPPHDRTRDLGWDGWARIARWARQMASKRGRDERDVAAQLVRAFMSSKRARERGYPPQFLAENPAEFWREAA